MATISTTPRVASCAQIVGRRLLSRPAPLMEAAAVSCSDVGSSSMAVDGRNRRSISSMTRSSLSQSIPQSSPVPPTYSAFRNKVTMPFEVEEGKPYVSPYAKFFANVEAGRTTLGTTLEIEKQALDLKEQHLECGIPESQLRFKTASYGRYALPPYVAPGEHRVTVQVALSAIPFESDQEKEVFMEIVGSRFNKERGVLQLSSEKFASRIENKRYLVDMIEKIVSNAKMLAAEFAEEEEKAKATA